MSDEPETTHECVWKAKMEKTKTKYYCEICGITSYTKQEDMMADDVLIEDAVIEDQKCRHVWECLRDRTHNRGKGKYQAYKCTLCGKFQRR